MDTKILFQFPQGMILKVKIKINHPGNSRLKRFITENNLPFGIVINNSEEVMMFTENIIQIPAGLV